MTLSISSKIYKQKLCYKYAIFNARLNYLPFMQNRFLSVSKSNTLLYLLPTLALLVYLLIVAQNAPLHDYATSYFAAHMIKNGLLPESYLFDIYQFNKYVWSQGYPKDLVDFYLNSPFTATAYYPFALVSNAVLSKTIFLSISSILFLIALFILAFNYLNKSRWILGLIPVIFFVPIRNNILFGQSYLLIFSLCVFAFYFFKLNRSNWGSSILSLAVLIKIFPLLYALPLLIKRKWKALGIFAISCIVLFLISGIVGGFAFWKVYLFEVFPNAILNESSIGYASNAQSIEVFLKNLFIEDKYYNPTVITDSNLAYRLSSWFLKSIVLGVAIYASLFHRHKWYKLLCIWVVSMFLLQSRTATYAQVLWLIPLFDVMKNQTNLQRKLLFICILGLVCNFPFHWLQQQPLIVEFSRLWLSIGLFVIYFYELEVNKIYRFVGIALLASSPFYLPKIVASPQENNSVYVLDSKEYFIIYDYGVNKNHMVYSAIGIRGDTTIQTSIEVHSFDTTNCSIINGQVYFEDQQLTYNHSLKKKAAVINDCELYYLTDHHGRRGAFSLKKIPLCQD